MNGEIAIGVALVVADLLAHALREDFSAATGLELAQQSLWFGVDDLDGTVQEEKIYHMAGSPTPEGMTTAGLTRLVRAAGREPYERDTLYNIVNVPALELPEPTHAM